MLISTAPGLRRANAASLIRSSVRTLRAMTRMPQALARRATSVPIRPYPTMASRFPLSENGAAMPWGSPVDAFDVAQLAARLARSSPA